MERYNEYKDSGVQWLGEIPSHWKIEPFGRHFKFRKGLPITKADLKENGIAVISYGQIHAKNNLGTTLTESLVRYVSQDYLHTHPRCLLTKKDFVFADTSEDIEGSGNFVYNDFKDDIFAGYHTIVARQDSLYNPKYYAYLFMSDAWKNRVRNLVNGVKVYSIGRKQLKDNFLLFPLPSEQDAIVDFLDKETFGIDKAIAMQQKMIDLLNERKQIIIQNAVTKGLDGNVEMKDSGVDMIGMIPNHWKVEPFGKHFTFGKGLPITKANLQEEGVAVISYGQIHAKNNLGTTMTESLVRYVSPKYLESHTQCLLNQNDFVFADTSEDIEGSGNFAFNDFENKLFAGYHTVIARPQDLFFPKYYAYLFKSKAWKSQIQSLVNGVKVYSIGRRILKTSMLLIPSEDEQKHIVGFLDEKTSAIEKSIENISRQISLLQERKQIIINEVVTGKVRVS